MFTLFFFCVPFLLWNPIRFFSSSQFHCGSFFLKAVHLFLSDSHWSLYNSVKCILMDGNMKNKQYGKVHLNLQIHSCICLVFVPFLSFLNWWLVSNNCKSPLFMLCLMCMFLCLSVIVWVRWNFDNRSGINCYQSQQGSCRHALSPCLNQPGATNSRTVIHINKIKMWLDKFACQSYLYAVCMFTSKACI